MSTQEAKRARRLKRLNTPVRLSKKRKKKLKLKGKRPVVRIKQIRNRNKSTEPPKRVKVPNKLTRLF